MQKHTRNSSKQRTIRDVIHRMLHDTEEEQCVFTGGLDDAVLVGFGGIAVPLTVSEPLDHLLRSSEPSKAVAEEL